MEKAKLVEAAKALNAAVYEDEAKDDVSSLISQKIKTTAVSDADLQTAFMEACNSIPEELEQFIPDSVSDVYNAIGDEIEADGTATSSAPKDKNPSPSKAAPPVKAEKAPKAENPAKVAKTPRFTRGDALIASLKKGGDARTICANIDEIYIANGGKENTQESKWIFGIMFPILIKINAIVEKDGKFQANF